MSAKARSSAGRRLRPIPDRLVVLTFDDGCKSDATYVAPLLKHCGFGATFFVNDASGIRDSRAAANYVTWDEVRGIHEAGFEIGNHTRSHPSVEGLSGDQFRLELEFIKQRCVEHGIPAPRTFCYPGFYFCRSAVEVLAEKGYIFARRGVFPEFHYDTEGGRGPAYDPAVDHPLLIPTTGFSGPHWGFDDLAWAVEQAAGGRIAVLCFHGVPDLDHPWVHTDPETFRKYVDFLRDSRCTVIAMRDLAQYVDPSAGPCDPIGAIERKQKCKQRT